MNRKKIIYLSILSLFFLLQAQHFVFAITPIEVPDYPSLKNNSDVTSTMPLPEYMKYIFDFGVGLGFFAAMIALIVGGAFYIFSAGLPNLKARAMDILNGAVTGLIILLLIYIIVTTINPNFKFFAVTPIKNIEKIKTIIPPWYGVVLYQDIMKSGVQTQSSTPNLANLANKITAVSIFNNPNGQEDYLVILHNMENYKGTCQLIYADTPTSTTNVRPFATSISILQYAKQPSGDGVTIYRKSMYDETGGWLKIRDSQITNIYQEELKNLKFTGNNGKCTVPEEEQDCIQWDFEHNCLKRECPTLSIDNINSIKINGKYAAILINYDEASDKWIACQVFPAPDDKNREGPRGLSFEYIRNQKNPPNWIAIIPLKQ